VDATVALNGPQYCLEDVTAKYQKRRDLVCVSFANAGLHFDKPKSRMFVWAKIPR